VCHWPGISMSMGRQRAHRKRRRTCRRVHRTVSPTRTRHLKQRSSIACLAGVRIYIGTRQALAPRALIAQSCMVCAPTGMCAMQYCARVVTTNPNAWARWVLDLAPQSTQVNGCKQHFGTKARMFVLKRVPPSERSSCCLRAAQLCTMNQMRHDFVVLGLRAHAARGGQRKVRRTNRASKQRRALRTVGGWIPM
jgi:hypothetical protein